MLLGKNLRGFQLGLEGTQGTIVAANRLIKNGTFKNSRKNNVKKGDAEGHRNAIGQQRGKKWSEWNCTGQLGHSVLSYWGAGIYDASAGASPTNPATGAYSYTFQDMNGTLHTPQIYSFEYGNSLGSNSKFAFGTLSDFTLNVSESACDYTVSGFGAYPTKNITMTATPTILPTLLTNFTDCKISYATTYSGLSSGKLLTAKEIELSVKGKYTYELFIDDATTSIGGILEKKPELTGKIVVAEGSESDNFLSNLETSTMFYLQLAATGPLIATGSPNTYNNFKYTWACFVEEEEETETQSLFAGSYNFYGAEDLTNGDTNLVVTNTLAAL